MSSASAGSGKQWWVQCLGNEHGPKMLTLDSFLLIGGVKPEFPFLTPSGTVCSNRDTPLAHGKINLDTVEGGYGGQRSAVRIDQGTHLKLWPARRYRRWAQGGG